MAEAFPSGARVVIIGGGIMGCGVAYHLAHEGWSDVVLLEKGELTSGSTWHAAGQITHSTSSYSLGRCVDYNIALYSGVLEAETGHSVTWHGCGSFRLAYSEDEMDWLRHTLSVGRALGFNIELVTPDRVAQLHPFYNLEGVLGALHTPDDGHVDPSGITQALAKGASRRGVRIIRGCRATGIARGGDGDWVVSTARGDIRCEHVVNAAGTYARQIGEWSGLQLPMTSMTHHYLVTDTVPQFADLDTELPVIRDDAMVSGYIRMEQKSGLIGIYEKANPNTVWEEHCPWEAENELFEADYERIMPWLNNAMERMPIFAELGIRREVHGAISHPPDGGPLVGPAPAVDNYWCACGTQIGIGWGPGLTRELARWMVHGAADINMREFDPRRFGAYATPRWQVIKAKEDYCLRHEIPFPHFNRLAGRPLKESSLYETLKQRGAVYEEVYGHERPRWFARGAVEQRDYYSFRHTAVDDMIAHEVAAVRRSAGLMDISAFTKVVVRGGDAESLLDNLVANRLPRRVGGVGLTHMLNRRGRIELETTVVRLAEDTFYLVCAAFFEQRLLDHLARHRGGGDVVIECVSDDWGALAINGPRARDILARCTPAALDNGSFRWLSAREIEVAGHMLWAIRLSYVGEMGYELHMPRAAMPDVYGALRGAGEDFGIVDYGSFAMNAMRMEKAFKGAGELTNEVTLPEADVMRFVRLDKDYIGRDATAASAQLAAAGEAGEGGEGGEGGSMPWVCAYLSFPAVDGIYGHGGEAVLCDGVVVGATASVAYSPTADVVLAFAYLKPEAARAGSQLQVLVHGAARAARVLDEPVYDPQGLLPRG